MRRFALDFLHRGMVACGLGPIVLAVIYLLLQRFANIEMLSVSQVCTGIFSITLLAFVAGGMNAIYQIERLPLMAAIMIHGCVLYTCYLGTYLSNDWLKCGTLPVLIFTGVFAVGYLVIWAIIYSIIKRSTAKLNDSLRKRQKIERQEK